MKIYTYHSPVPQLSIKDETRLLLLWKDSWARFGYEPVVLNEFIAQRNKLFPVLDDHIRRNLPSINPANYDRACYMRWLAMLEVNGGLMSDYDVIPYVSWQPNFAHPPKKLATFQGHVPSLVYGNKIAFLNVVNAFLHYKLGPEDIENGKPHISDMHILVRSVEFSDYRIVENFGEKDWQEAKIVHYSTSAMSAKNLLPRWKHIPTLRNLV